MIRALVFAGALLAVSCGGTVESDPHDVPDETAPSGRLTPGNAPPDHCEAKCSKLAAAECPGDLPGAYKSCLAECDAWVAEQPIECAAELDAAFACIVADTAVECSEQWGNAAVARESGACNALVEVFESCRDGAS